MTAEPKPPVDGWHRGCPAKEEPPAALLGALGTYALVREPDGSVSCAACGERELVTREEARRG